jgi:hypothetical protein
MTKLIATSFLLFLFINVDAQLALDKNKLLVQKTIDSLYHGAFHSAAKWVTMKDTLVFFPTGQTHPDTSEQSSPYKIGFWINQKGLCKIEMQEYLNKQAFENGLAFISSYDQFLLLELPPESPEFKLKIFRTSWSKELYQLLTSTKN